MDWGGFEFSLRKSAPDSVASSVDSVPVPDSTPVALELAPLLYAGFRQGDTALVYPVGELAEEGLRPLPGDSAGEELARHILRTRLRPGEELTLFHEGTRVGTLVVRGEGEISRRFCSPRARASGPIELVPSADDIERFLALEESLGRQHPMRPFRQLQSEYEQRVASLDLASGAIASTGARWPPSVLDIRQDLQVFRLPDDESASVIATFLFRDRLRVEPPGENAYSLLVLGEPRGGSFDRTFTWYRPADEAGKAAPRYFSRMDWDLDGRQEILLEVLGEEDRWFAGLQRGPEAWSVTFQDSCGVPTIPAAPPPSGP